MSDLTKFAKKLELKLKLAQDDTDQTQVPVNPVKDDEMKALWKKLESQLNLTIKLSSNLQTAINTINRIPLEGHTDPPTSIEFYKDAMNRLKYSLTLIDATKTQLPNAIATLNLMIQTLSKRNKS